MNYDGASAAGAAAAGGALAVTGPGWIFWACLAGFAMLAVGSALRRIAPARRGR